jgi:hypothetical protein
MKRCPACSRRIRDDAVVCRYCDAGVDGPQPGPLAPVGGGRVTWMFTGNLSGPCPRCRRTTTFSALPVSPADALPGAQGPVAAMEHAKRLLQGAKLALPYFCQRCNERFHVCRACLRPNLTGKRTGVCAYCATPMIL